MRRVILHNFWLKLVSIGLGALIWLALHSQVQSDSSVAQPRITGQMSRLRFRIPIFVIAQPGDGRVFKLSHREAVMDVEGEDAVLRRLAPGDLKVYVDLTGFNSHQSTSEVLRPYVPPNVIVSDIQPTTILVELVAPPIPLK